MLKMKNLDPSLVDENNTPNLGNVNPAYEGLSSPELEMAPSQLSTQRQEMTSSELDVANIQLEEGKEVSSDEWWNYVHSMVQKDEAEASENNNNNDIISARYDHGRRLLFF